MKIRAFGKYGLLYSIEKIQFKAKILVNILLGEIMSIRTMASAVFSSDLPSVLWFFSLSALHFSSDQLSYNYYLRLN